MNAPATDAMQWFATIAVMVAMTACIAGAVALLAVFVTRTIRRTRRPSK